MHGAASTDMYLFESEEHLALREQVRRWAAREIAPHALRWDEEESFDRDLYRRAGSADILGIGYDERVGGSGGDLGHMIAASEEMILAGHSVGACVGLGSHSIALPPIIRHGTPEQIERFVRPVLAGEKVSALGITEPNAGSDVASIRTRAVRAGDHYVVEGSKTFITSGVRADFVTAAVRTGGEQHGGISLLIVEASTPGYRVGRKLKKTGWCASDTGEIFFDRCRVPVANLIGRENVGFALIMENFVSERLLIAAQCVAIAELALRESVTYAQNRKAFGRAISGFQVTRHKLADMLTRLAGARALTGEAVARALSGRADPVLAAMAKNHATDMCSFVCDQAVQIHGGAGYMRETLVERLYRDARLYPIGGGTREIMNELIAKARGF